MWFVCYKKLNTSFQGLLSAVQPFSHPLIQPPLPPLIIGLPCETYNRVSPGKLFLSNFFKQRTSRNHAQGISDMHKHRPYQGTHLYTSVKKSNMGRIFAQKNSDGPGGIRTLDPWIPSPGSYHQSAFPIISTFIN